MLIPRPAPERKLFDSIVPVKFAATTASPAIVVPFAVFPDTSAKTSAPDKAIPSVAPSVISLSRMVSDVGVEFAMLVRETPGPPRFVIRFRWMSTFETASPKTSPVMSKPSSSELLATVTSPTIRAAREESWPTPENGSTTGENCVSRVWLTAFDSKRVPSAKVTSSVNVPPHGV